MSAAGSSRGAGSLYRINGDEARARDVQLLFADAGSGARSAAIIGQGQIGFIVDAKPQERRRLIEEAAGIGGLQAGAARPSCGSRRPKPISPASPTGWPSARAALRGAREAEPRGPALSQAGRGAAPRRGRCLLGRWLAASQALEAAAGGRRGARDAECEAGRLLEARAERDRASEAVARRAPPGRARHGVGARRRAPPRATPRAPGPRHARADLERDGEIARTSRRSDDAARTPALRRGQAESACAR